MKRHFVWTLAVLIIIAFLSLPGISMARGLETTNAQIGFGAIATLGGNLAGWISLFYVLSETNSKPLVALGLASLVGTPLATSSTVVYAIGRLDGYDGSYLVTLLSGVLPTLGLIYVESWFLTLATEAAIFDSIKEGPPAWFLPLILGSMLLVPTTETIGFHLSDSGFHLSARNSHTNIYSRTNMGSSDLFLNGQGETRFSIPLLSIKF